MDGFNKSLRGKSIECTSTFDYLLEPTWVKMAASASEKTQEQSIPHYELGLTFVVVVPESYSQLMLQDFNINWCQPKP